MDRIKKLVMEYTNGNKTAFARLTGIPLRTIEEWCAGRRNPPEYILSLLEFSLQHGYETKM